MNIACTINRGKDGQPLVELELGAPRDLAALSPMDLEMLGQRLLAVAALAKRMPMGGKHWQVTRMVVGSVARAETASTD